MGYGVLQEKLRYYKKKVYDQKQLIAVSQAFHSELQGERLLKSILEISMVHARTGESALFIAQTASNSIEEIRSFTLAEECGELFVNPNRQPTEKLTITDELYHCLVNSGDKRTLSSLLRLFPTNRELQRFKRAGVEIVFPLRGSGRLNGLMLLGQKLNQSRYSRREIEFLSDMSVLGGIALDNHRLYEQLTVDSLTGLKNRSFFDHRMLSFWEAARSGLGSFQLLLADVDHFKQINDTHGHCVGDEVLRQVGKLLLGRVVGDERLTSCRYGGEEFGLIYQGDDHDQALHLAESLRRDVENIGSVDGLRLPSITISIGISGYDAVLDGKSHQGMIERADRALYHCKRNGRNRVKICNGNLSN